MSAFIVSEKTMQNVVCVAKRVLKNQGSDPFDMAGDKPEDWQNLGDRLYEMNVEAVDYRYREKNGKQPFRYQLGWYCSDVQGLKSVACLKYQCSEGNLPETPLYIQLEHLQRILAMRIVEKTKEYEEADYD